MSLFYQGDNKHTFRPAQIFAKEELEKHWEDYDIFIVPFGVGTGKSAIGRMVQLGFPDKKTCYITPQNNLIRQVKSTYPEINAVMGRAQYTCKSGASYSTSSEDIELTCEDIYYMNEDSLCKGCYYSDARTQEYKEKDTVYNVFSYMDCISKRGKVISDRQGDINVIDEADACLAILKDFAGLQLSVRNYEIEEGSIHDSVYVSNWLRDLGIHFETLARDTQDPVKKAVTYKKADKFFKIANSLEQDWDLFAVELKEGRRSKILDIKPLHCPTSIIQKLLGKTKTVFMSATIFKEDLEEFKRLGYRIKTIKATSAIPERNRTIFHVPDYYEGYKANQVPVEKMAYAIKHLAKKVKCSHILVHTTYRRSGELAAALYEQKVKAITHTQTDKRNVIEEWQAKGGLLLGAGCDTGLDLKYNLCRLNIVTQIRFPSLGSEWVKKKLKTRSGNLWYKLEALRFLMQAFGRGVRAPDDWCLNICLDKNITWLIHDLQKAGVDIPQWFIDSIRFYPEEEDIDQYLLDFKETI